MTIVAKYVSSIFSTKILLFLKLVIFFYRILIEVIDGKIIKTSQQLVRELTLIFRLIQLRVLGPSIIVGSSVTPVVRVRIQAGEKE